jgi:DNA-binding NtrC family response regulator
MRLKKNGEVLLVGAELSANEELRRELGARSYEIATAKHGEEGFAKATGHEFDVVVSDLVTLELSGLEMLRRLQPVKPHLPVILVDNDANVESAIEAAKLGVYAYIVTPFNMPELVECIVRASSRGKAVMSKLEVGGPQVTQSRLVGSSRVMQDLYKQIGRAADSPLTILISGATGTGKELVARAIHQHSKRANRPFIPVNCSAIPEALLESELFGHEAGAFTGASARRFGMFERAEGGTLFLDEIGDLTLSTQVKLLRVLQEHRICRLGGSQEIALNVRVIAATHRDIEALMESGAFRRDLFYRLNGLTIKPPQLCEHRADILELTKHFLRRWQMDPAAGPLSICRNAVDFLERQVWPGNVRELENAVSRAALLAQGQPIELAHVQEACSNGKAAPAGNHQYRPEPLTDLVERARAGEIKNLRARVLEQAERSLLERVMAFSNGSQAKMAKFLGVTRSTARQRMRKLGILQFPSEARPHNRSSYQNDRESNPATPPSAILHHGKGAEPGSLRL